MAAIKISPSILNADFTRLGEQIAIVEEAGADCLHLDVMDGHFVPNLSFGPPIIERIRTATKLPLDAHLMISNPDSHLAAYQQAGADSVTVHAEVCPNLPETIDAIHALNLAAGVALNPNTPESILGQTLLEIELVLVMTVFPGFGGQAFMHEVVPKVRKLAALIGTSGKPISLQVDGGIDQATIPLLVQAGADNLVIGSAIYGQEDIKGTFLGMRDAIAAIQSDHPDSG